MKCALGCPCVRGKAPSFWPQVRCSNLPMVAPSRLGGATEANTVQACVLAEVAFDRYRDTAPDIRAALMSDLRITASSTVMPKV